MAGRLAHDAERERREQKGSRAALSLFRVSLTPLLDGSRFSYSLAGVLTCRKLGREVAVLDSIPFCVDRDRVG